jgi:hypothetical protein
VLVYLNLSCQECLQQLSIADELTPNSVLRRLHHLAADDAVVFVVTGAVEKFRPGREGPVGVIQPKSERFGFGQWQTQTVLIWLKANKRI